MTNSSNGADDGSRLQNIAIMSVIVLLLVVVGLVQTMQRSVRLPETGAAAGGERLPDMRLDINRASAAELSVLPGVGPSLAQRIVDDRTLNGAFATIEDIDRVHGIGPAIIERIKPYVIVEPVHR